MITEPEIGKPWGIAAHGVVTDIEDLGKGYLLLTMKRSTTARARQFTVVRDYDPVRERKRWSGSLSRVRYGYRHLELYVGDSHSGLFEFRARFPDAALDPMLEFIRKSVTVYG